MSPVNQQAILHYRILEKIGEGGMGTVYKALDTRLDRLVALKVLPAIADPTRKRQFIWEARAAAGLRHPNIVVVHDLVSDGHADCIVMEYLPGRPLSESLSVGALPLADALRYAREIASALEEAHAAGIVHRDLKPSNILLTEEGCAKLVDFGLARLQDQSGAAIAGGTYGYMAPEQAQGEPATPQSDIFAFGAVLYEMLSGRRAFPGKSSAAVLAAVLRDDPAPLASLAPAVSQVLVKIVEQCLRKQPRRRFQHMGDVRIALEEVKPQPLFLRWRMPALGRRALLYAALAATPVLGSWLILRRHVEPEIPSMPIPLTSYPGIEQEATWSPDGRQLAFISDGGDSSRADVYVLQPGSSQRLRLTFDPGENSDPAWSPDGRWIAYVHVAPDWRHYSLNLISALGGTPQTVVNSEGLIGAPNWTPDARALFVSMAPDPKSPLQIWAIFMASGERRRITNPPLGTPGDLKPAVSPDAATLAFCRKTGWRTSELYLADLRPDLSMAGAPRRVTDFGYVAWPAWTPDGSRIVFEAHRDGFGIWQVDRSGNHARPVFGAPDSASEPALVRRPGGQVSLVFTDGVSQRSLWRYGLRQGAADSPVRLAASSRDECYPRYSNDGRRLAFSADRTGYQEVWVANADGSEPVQLTDLRYQLTEVGHWSPDSEAIAFVAQDRGQRQIYVIGSSGGPAVRITNEDGVGVGTGWTHDGIAYYYNSMRTGRNEVWRVPRTGGRTAQMTVDGGEDGFETSHGVFYYWRREPGRGPLLMRREAEGDREVPLEPRGDPLHLTVPVPGGFYYRARGTGDVYRYDEASGRSTLALPHPDKPFNQFTISPDGRWFATDFLESEGLDLMIMERFR